MVSEKKIFDEFSIVSLWQVMMPPGWGLYGPRATVSRIYKEDCMDPRGTVGRIYKEDHYTLQHTKYESSGPCGFGEDFFMFSHCMSMGANDPWGGAIFDSRGMVGRIYKEDHYTLLHTKYKSSRPYGLGEEDFCLCFFP